MAVNLQTTFLNVFSLMKDDIYLIQILLKLIHEGPISNFINPG